MKWCYDNGVCSEVPTAASAQDLASALLSAFELSAVSLGATNDEIFCILVAEDNLVNQKLAIKMLEKYGHTVEAVENGPLAVDVFKARVLENRPFDIILVRVTSPCPRVPEVNQSSCHGADGCFYADNGRYGGDRVDPRV